MRQLPTQTRLIALLCLLFAGGIVILWVLNRSHTDESARLRENARAERIRLIDSLLELRSESLSHFAHDYTFWDEMVTFAQQPDPAWAVSNIEVSLATFRAHGAWVLDTKGRQVYGVVRELDDSVIPLPVEIGALQPLLERDRFLRFFATTKSGVLEFHTAPIQPTADVARTSPPQGWFIVARLWDTAFISGIQHSIGGHVELLPEADASEPADSDPGAIRVDHPLRGFDGRPVAVLRTDYTAESVNLINDANVLQRALFLVFGSSAILLITVSVSRWVLRPLRTLEDGLSGRIGGALDDLKREPDVLGRLAHLVESSVTQRHALEQEIEERRRIEEALHQSQESLVSAAAMRTRLARDLHDGIIQSIYAAGLGLEGVRGLLRTDPESADRRLDATQASLNQTIREVRSFIQGLEPESGDRPAFVQSLQSLVATLQSLHLVEIQMRLDPSPLHLTAREEVHALQILRESVSNAIRHGQATCINVALTAAEPGPLLIIEDNGRGFEPALAAVPMGSGLANLASRAQEIGATLDISSQPGNGTRIALQFVQR